MSAVLQNWSRKNTSILEKNAFLSLRKKKGLNNPNEFDAFLHVQNQKI